MNIEEPVETDDFSISTYWIELLSTYKIYTTTKGPYDVCYLHITSQTQLRHKFRIAAFHLYGGVFVPPVQKEKTNLSPM